MLLSLLLSCATEFEVQEVVPEPVTEAESLDPVHLLARISLDVRGVRPSMEEIAQVQADPAAVDTLTEAWLLDERFGERVRALYANAFLTRQDAWFVTAADYGLEDQPGFAAAVGEEPLRIVSHVAMHDLPYTEIVTGDWTMANEQLAAAWPLEYPEGATGWQVARYTDGRPTAGVLTTNAMWWRHMGAAANANRGRANAVSKALLCADYLSKPIEFDRNVNILDSAALNDALQNNPGCVACHYSLDPLAAYFWGFFFYDYASAEETSIYHAERERMWETYGGGVAPGYYGEPGYTLNDLGVQLADDPRLTTCAVERVFGGLLQRDLTLDDTEGLLTHRAAFESGGLTLRSLFRSVLTSPEYRAAPSDDPQAAPPKMLEPEQLASAVEDLTGYRFTYAGYDMLTTDTYGLRTLAGGVDGQFVTAPARAPTATLLLVVERLSQGAADHVVDHDRQDPDAARLFTEVRFVETPATDLDAMVAQLQVLHLRLFGDVVAADGPEVAANLALWSELYALEHDPAAAWAGVLSVLLRDPRFLLY